MNITTESLLIAKINVEIKINIKIRNTTLEPIAITKSMYVPT